MEHFRPVLSIKIYIFFNRARISVNIRILVEPKVKIWTSARIRKRFRSQVPNPGCVRAGKTLQCAVHGVLQEQG